MPYKKHTLTKYLPPSPRALAGGGFALVVLMVAMLWPGAKPDRVRKPLPELALAVAPASAAEKSTPLKLVYRNSVIPGGVHSAAELAHAVQRDAVITAHYANFDVAAARLVQVEKSRLVHVSYRIGDKVYWTKNKVRLALGETLLSDGKHLARTRCGNRIADEPEGVVLDNEPAPEVLEAVFVSADDLIDQTVNLSAGVVAAPAVVTNTAAAQAQDTRLASLLLSVNPIPAIVLPNLSYLHAPAQALSAHPVTPVAFAPLFVEYFDPNIFVPGTSGEQPAPGTNPVPGGIKPQSPVLPDSPNSDTPMPALGPQAATPMAATPTPVPEPGSAALAGLALIALALVRRGAGRNRRS